MSASIDASELALREFEATLLYPEHAALVAVDAIPDTLRESIRKVSVLRDQEPLPIDELLPHLAVVVESAPFLLSARSSFLLLPEDTRHLRLRASWQLALSGSRKNSATLCNACDFFLRWDDANARRTITEALAIAPEASLVLQTAGEYHFHGSDLGWNGCTYTAASAYLSRARATSPIPHFITFIGHAAMAALEAGDEDRARSLANEAIAPSLAPADENWHLGQCVLGRLALREGDVAGATAALQAAQLGSWWAWGPSLRLARELAVQGYVAEVRRFLNAVSEWKGRRPAGLGERWLSALEAGRFEDLVNPGR